MDNKEQVLLYIIHASRNIFAFLRGSINFLYTSIYFVENFFFFVIHFFCSTITCFPA